MRLRNIPGAKEAVETSAWCIDLQKALTLPGNWKAVFGNDHPIHVEVGMGKGRFLMDMARLHPEINYLGIERYDSVLLRALEKREKLLSEGQEMQNLLFLCLDARLLPELFAPGEVERIYLNFSDPWPKARHRSRRLPSREFLERYEKILSRQGRVEFKTDNQDLFSFALFEAKESGWPLLYETRDLHAEKEMPYENVCTEYEEKFVSLHKPICKMVLSPPLR